MRPLRDESLAYHAARLLLLLQFAGSPQRRSDRLPGLRGRTLLAKLDFFLRYPSYLLRAAELRKPDIAGQIVVGPEGTSVESQMIRYLYGPWDDIYFSVIAYLAGKGLVDVEVEGGVETFRLTLVGREASLALAARPEFLRVAERAKVAASIFPNVGGTALKEFIYQNFPEIAAQRVGETI